MVRSDPPKWADWLVERICPEEYLEEVQGDLHEAFHWRKEARGQGYARRKFFWEAIITIRLIRFKTPDIMKNWYFRLLKNYFITGSRFLWKTRALSSINIFGLAIGITFAALSYLFLSNQLSFDRFHKNADQLYRITGSMEWNGNPETMGGASYIMGEAFPSQVPGITRASHIKNDLALRPEGDDYDYQVFHYADRDLFDMLDFTFISGGPGDFERPDQIVVSESFAESLTQTDDLTLIFGDQEEIFSISGIFKDLPSNSTLQPQIIIPFSFWVSSVPERRTVTWFDINMNVFIQKSKEAEVEEIEKAMNEVMAANFDVSETKARVHLQAFSDMHMDTSLGLGNGLRRAADQEILRVVFWIGLLCLLIACFNYSNFATGNFLSRSREVALRKVMGAPKGAIFQQFLSESFLSTALAGMLAIVLVIIVLPLFSIFVNEVYSPEQLLNSRFVLGFIGILAISTLLSGLYPSTILSSRKVEDGLKSQIKVGGKSIFGWFLVMLQVSLTIFLITGMLTVDRQLKHLVNFDLGYNDDNILQLSIRDTSDRRVDRLQEQLKQLPFVAQVSANSGYNGTDVVEEGRRIEVAHLRTDPEFLNLMGIELVAGRNFDANIQTDGRDAIIVNETFVKAAQLENPIGTQVPFDYGDLDGPRIIGVVKDYRMESPKTAIEPLVMYISPEYQYQNMLVQLQAGVSNQNLQQIEDLWREFYPRQPINYTWLDELNEGEMQTEAQIRQLSRAGSLTAIILASLGLFGIVGTHVRQRLKEISIRKVNGASPWDIYRLFSGKFGTWLFLGFVLGAIPAVYFLKNWLDNYPERIQLGLGTPLLSVLICGLVFLAIISLLLSRVIFVNPAVYLKDE